MKKYLGFIALVLVGTMLISCSVLPGIFNQDSDDTSDPGAPLRMKFGSLDEVTRFIVAVNGGESEYEAYREANLLLAGLVPYEKAVRIAENLTLLAVPVIAEGKSDIVLMRIDYHVDWDELLLVYDVEGVSYVFSYFYNNDKENTYEEDPVLTQVPFGSVLLDMYPTTLGYIVGSFISGTTKIRAKVYTDQVSDISFDGFEFAMIPSHMGNDTPDDTVGDTASDMLEDTAGDYVAE